jgi:hypothetical protein
MTTNDENNLHARESILTLLSDVSDATWQRIVKAVAG